MNDVKSMAPILKESYPKKEYFKKLKKKLKKKKKKD